MRNDLGSGVDQHEAINVDGDDFFRLPILFYAVAATIKGGEELTSLVQKGTNVARLEIAQYLFDRLGEGKELRSQLYL